MISAFQPTATDWIYRALYPAAIIELEDLDGTAARLIAAELCG